MNVDPARTPRRRRRPALALALWVALILLTACDKAHEPAVAPANVVMPADATSAASAGSSPPRVSIAPEVAAASDASASAPMSVGVPSAPSASLPGAARIGPAPASSSTSDQPPSVSPGTKS